MVEFQVFPSEVPTELWEKMSWSRTNAKSRRVPGHIGRFNFDGIELQLSRYPSAGSPYHGENRLPDPLTPRDFRLSIRFNPTMLYQGHNFWGYDGSTILRAITEAQERLQTLGLHCDLLQLSLTEIHLTRDVVWYAEPGSTLTASHREWMAMNQALRVMEWGRPLYARKFEDYANRSTPAQKVDERRNVGLERGSKYNKWVVYDKVQENEDQGKPLPPLMTGRLMRVEWRIKRASQIEKHLKIRNVQDWIARISAESENQLIEIRDYIEHTKSSSFDSLASAIDLYSEPGDEFSLYQTFDKSFVQCFFISEKPYTRRMPTIPSIFVEAIAKHFTSDIQRGCLERIRESNSITQSDLDILVVVLNGIGAARTRAILRDAFGLDVTDAERLDEPEHRRRRRNHDACAKMLFRLRLGAHYNALYTWSDLRHWMLMEWEAYDYMDVEFPNASRDNNEVLSAKEFRTLAFPFLEQLLNYPNIHDLCMWGVKSAIHRPFSFCEAYCLPEDLISVYRQMNDVENTTIENPRVRYSDEQKLVIWRARELEILPLFPETKKRAARIKAPKLPGI